MAASSASLGKSSVAAANDFFQTLEHPFWNFHYTLTSKASPKKMALIGESRVADILANVLFPFWVAHDLKASARRAHCFGQNMRSCRRNYQTADSKPLRRVSLEMILAGNNFCELSRTSKVCFRSTKTFACRTIPIARNARFRNRWRNGSDLKCQSGACERPLRIAFAADTACL